MKNLTSIAEHSDYLSASTYSDSEKWQLHRLRVKFGKQPLEIWQFTPCKLVDGVWVVLEKPKRSNDWNFGILVDFSDELISEWEEYLQAKERCLFEGFKIQEHEFNTYSVRCENNIVNPMWCFIDNNWVCARGTTKIEDLVKYNIQLTPTAQKQL